MRLHRFGSSPPLLLCTSNLLLPSFFGECSSSFFFCFSLFSADDFPLFSGATSASLYHATSLRPLFRHAQLRSGTEEKREKSIDQWRKGGAGGKKGKAGSLSSLAPKQEEKRKISRFSRQFSGEGAGGRGRAPTDQGKPGHPDDLSPPHRVRHRRPVSESARKCAPSSLEAFAGRPVPISDPVRRPGGGHV